MTRLSRSIFAVCVPALLLMSCTSSDSQKSPSSDPLTKMPDTSASVFARFVPEREDDFTWENDRVAFRVYGPASPAKGPISGVDAWFKSVDYPIINKWYKEHLSGQSYHEDTGEGYDVYHTGTSRGVGGTAIWVDGKAYPAPAFKSWKIIDQNDDYVAFVLDYEWSTPLGRINETKTVSLREGSQLYDVSSVFQLNGKNARLPVAIGLTTHDGAAVGESDVEEGFITTSETIDGKKVWTAAVVDPKAINDIATTSSETKDDSHIWMLVDTGTDGVLSYSAGFAWEGARLFENQGQWKSYLASYK